MDSVLTKSVATKMQAGSLCLKLPRKPKARSKRMQGKAVEPSCSSSMQDTALFMNTMVLLPSQTPTIGVTAHLPRILKTLKNGFVNAQMNQELMLWVSLLVTGLNTQNKKAEEAQRMK